jgi:hypothetical protein
VAPREEELDRPEQQGASEEGDEQSEGAFTGKLAGRAPPQRKPASRPCHQEKEGHSPRVEKDVDERDCLAALSVLDLEVGGIEHIAGMEEEDPKCGDDAQPVEIVQAYRWRNGWILHDDPPDTLTRRLSFLCAGRLAHPADMNDLY